MTEIATLAGGCFWCMEAVFQRLNGVESVTSGYMGGHIDSPSYEQVCSGNSGHAEVIEISFDPSRISFDTLLDVFFTIHDPCTLNRQGNDIGSQYRSVIFYHGNQQLDLAVAKMIALAPHYSADIVTELAPASTFWPAEDYHHDYFIHHPEQSYCALVVAEKVNKAIQKFSHLMRNP